MNQQKTYNQIPLNNRNLRDMYSTQPEHQSISQQFEKRIFKCPFRSDHTKEISGLTNYYHHLCKCQLVFLHYSQDPNEHFHLCPYCLQIFPTLQEATQCRLECKSKFGLRPALIRDDKQWMIKLGTSARFSLDCIVKIVTEQQEKTEVQPFQSFQLIQQGRQSAPLFQKKYLPIMLQEEDECVMIHKNKLQFILSERDQRIQVLNYKLYNQFNIDQISIKTFSQAITTDFLYGGLLKRYSIQMNKDTFQKVKVMEFVEDIQNGIEEEMDDKIYFSIQKDRQKNDVLWILANETNNFFSQLIQSHPWGLFKIQTNVNLDNLPKYIKPANQSESKLKQLKELLDQKKEELNKLIHLDHQMHQKFLYQNDILAQTLKEIKDQISSNQKKAAQIQLQNEKSNNLNKSVQDAYDEQIRAIKYKFQNYLDDKKLEIKKEIDQQLVDAQKAKEYYQPEYDRLVEEDQQLRDQELEIQKRYDNLQEHQKIKKMPSNPKKTIIQEIDQLLCIECKIYKRSVLIKPCSHFLLCEHCFQKLAQKGVQCPMRAFNKCSSPHFLNKYIVVNLINQ